MEPMETAPKDGRDVLVRVRGRGMRRAYYIDCEWLREQDPEVTDCWRPTSGRGADIELEDALGWRPAD